MDVRVIRVFLANRIVEDISDLSGEVEFVRDSVSVIAVLPDFSGLVFAGGEGEAAFDELHAAFDGVVRRWSDDDVDVVGHDDEGIEKETSGIAVAEERRDEEAGDKGALEDAAAVVGDRGDGVGLEVLPHGRRVSQGLKPGL